MAEVADSPGPLEPQARHVVYCGVCTLPPEYCEFGGTAKKCEEWLEAKQPDLWNKLYSEAAQTEARDAERKAASKIQIKRVERNKRKHVTVIIGLEVFGLENKKLAKDLGKKFATGSSMTRSAAGTEEITVQGDVSEDVREWLLEVHGDKVPRGNIELIEDKKKKKADAAAGIV
ncbi:Translation machinery-associated protein 22 [Penicillium cosmopolitanum]|uniref:Translation machinery-associated protein 22 n=1 Tax=Penicillium cosmopolitanum TaxID=1131564 RepID=A0A9W9S030_9EURO|nr:Translation machinery-associated protein 22 [Penicillium cosmopolitanum]KAJ5369441.1 Translation machinery-associated protein 22 [Penicillium cosmopolitanum]